MRELERHSLRKLAQEIVLSISFSVIIFKIGIFIRLRCHTLNTFTLKSRQIRRYINIECNATLYLFVMLEELQFSEPEY